MALHRRFAGPATAWADTAAVEAVLAQGIPTVLFSLFRGRKWADSAAAVYGAIVEQARQPLFYERLGVADNLDGRFDMICLHAALVIRRLQACGRDGQELAQKLFDVMFQDMDRNLREMGVGDLSVGKHVKRMAKAFYGRAAAYEDGLRSGDEELRAALRRNLYRGVVPEDWQVASMAGYARREAERLDGLSFQQFAGAQLGFAAPQVGADAAVA